jgi:hypothetical protein
MSQARNQFDTRRVAIYLAGGAIVVLVAAQILAKPGTPRNQSRRQTVVVNNGDTPAAPPLVAVQTVRPLFRPLVAPKKETQPAAVATPPAAVTPVTPAPAAPAPGPSVSPTPPAPQGPRASEIEMLGVVEIGGEAKALLRKTPTGESRYFAKGEDAFGFKVEEIKDTEVSVSLNGRRDRVMMSTAVVIEGPGGAAAAGGGGFGGNSFGGGGFGGGRFGGGRFGGGDSEGGRRFGRDRGDRGDRNGGGSSEASNPTSSIMALPTWTERLKKLEELKAQIPADSYNRLKSFIERRAAEEKK